jgi:hypothetical protein
VPLCGNEQLGVDAVRGNSAKPVAVMLDTCVWLDLAQPINEPLLAALEQIVHLNDIELLVPQIVRDEFARNKPRIIKESGRSVAGALKRASSAVSSYNNKRKRNTALDVLMDVEHALGHASDVTSGSLSRIEKLLATVPTHATTDGAIRRASQRALEKRAPFHNGKNNFADALLIELYGKLSKKAATRFLFVTHNIHDFSMPNGDNRLPHPELASFFSRIKSRYFVKLADALRSVRYDTFEYALYDTEHFDMEPRRASEIHEVIEEFFDRVWYDRHMVLYWQIHDGKVKIVTEYDAKKHNETVVESVWLRARKAAERLEKKYGKESLGPYSQFDWGMINGKLSALRWVMGDEWDMLDT